MKHFRPKPNVVSSKRIETIAFEVDHVDILTKKEKKNKQLTEEGQRRSSRYVFILRAWLIETNQLVDWKA
jgi:hypothetical protein